MLRAGLIIAGVMLVLGAGVSLLSGFCVPCLALFAGLGAGYLGSLFEKPGDNSTAMKRGAGAGAIGGVGALLGQVIGAGLNALIVGPQAAADVMRSLGVDAGDVASNPAAYYGGAILGGCCLGLFNIALMAGLGVLGGILWWQLTGKNQGGMSSAPPAMLA
jgi:hypothetical protein